MRGELSTIILILWSPSSSSAAAALSYPSPCGTMEMQSNEMNCPGNSLAERDSELDLGLCDQQCQARAFRSPTEGWPWIKYYWGSHTNVSWNLGHTGCLLCDTISLSVSKRLGPPPHWLLAAHILPLSEGTLVENRVSERLSTMHSSKHFTCTASFPPSK